MQMLAGHKIKGIFPKMSFRTERNGAKNPYDDPMKREFFRILACGVHPERSRRTLQDETFREIEAKKPQRDLLPLPKFCANRANVRQ
jgi:hypothetical protein